jgi:hypothetical protein
MSGISRLVDKDMLERWPEIKDLALRASKGKEPSEIKVDGGMPFDMKATLLVCTEKQCSIVKINVGSFKGAKEFLRSIPNEDDRAKGCEVPNYPITCEEQCGKNAYIALQSALYALVPPKYANGLGASDLNKEERNRLLNGGASPDQLCELRTELQHIPVAFAVYNIVSDLLDSQLGSGGCPVILQEQCIP